MASDKESQLREQILKLRERATNRGCASAQVDDAIRHTMRRYSPSRRWGCCRVCFVICAILVLAGTGIYMLKRHQAVHFLAVHSYTYIFRPLRFLALPLLRRWGFLTKYYRANCLLDNPYYVEKDDVNALNENCACAGIDGPKMANVIDVFRSDQLFGGSQPIIVERTFPSTLGERGMDVGKFLSLFEENMEDFEKSNCGLLAFGQSSTINFAVSVGDMIEIAKGKRSSSSFMAASWILCPGSRGEELVEALAPMQKLKPALDTGLIISKDPSLLMAIRQKDFPKFKQAALDGFMPPQNSFAALVQLIGVERIRLMPANCAECKPMHFDLHAGDTLFYNRSVWVQDVLVNGVAGTSLAYSMSYVWPETEEDTD